MAKAPFLAIVLFVSACATTLALIPAQCDNVAAYASTDTTSTVKICCPIPANSDKQCGEHGTCVDVASDSTFKTCGKWWFPWTKYCKCDSGWTGPGCADKIYTNTVRKDYVLGLTAAERKMFNEVIVKMKEDRKKYRHPKGIFNNNTGFPTYDSFGTFHQWAVVFQNDPGSAGMNPVGLDLGHNGTLFLTFHRYLSARFDDELHAYGWPSNLGSPFWNITISDPAYWDVVFSDSGFGSTGDPTSDPPFMVRDGPFAYSTMFWADGTVYPYPLNVFTRNVDFTCGGFLSGWPNASQIQRLIHDTKKFDIAPYWGATSSFRGILGGEGEGDDIARHLKYIASPHTWGHCVTGGMMGTFAGPNDPVFWLVHNYVDAIYDEWLTLNPTESAWPVPADFSTDVKLREFGPDGCAFVYPPQHHKDIHVVAKKSTFMGYTYEHSDLSKLPSLSKDDDNSPNNGNLVYGLVSLILILMILSFIYSFRNSIAESCVRKSPMAVSSDNL